MYKMRIDSLIKIAYEVDNRHSEFSHGNNTH